MVNRKVWKGFFAYFFTLLFGVLLYAVSSGYRGNPVELFIFFVLFSASVGLIFKKEWARKLICAASVGGICYFVFKQIVFLHAFDLAALSVMGICVIVFFVCWDPFWEALFSKQTVVDSKWIVLVVDDDLTFVKLVKSHFSKRGITVISSESGERGLEMAKRWQPNLIILDVILPGMKGRSVCAKLKEDAATANIPVMFVTFKNSLDDISAEMELGAVMHLTKPVNYDHLYEQVNKILIKG